MIYLYQKIMTTMKDGNQDDDDDDDDGDDVSFPGLGHRFKPQSGAQLFPTWERIVHNWSLLATMGLGLQL